MEVVGCCERMRGCLESGNNFRVDEKAESIDLHADDGALVFGNIDRCPFCGALLEIE